MNKWNFYFVFDFLLCRDIVGCKLYVVFFFVGFSVWREGVFELVIFSGLNFLRVEV